MSSLHHSHPSHRLRSTASNVDDGLTQSYPMSQLHRCRGTSLDDSADARSTYTLPPPLPAKIRSNNINSDTTHHKTTAATSSYSNVRYRPMIRSLSTPDHKTLHIANSNMRNALPAHNEMPNSNNKSYNIDPTSSLTLPVKHRQVTLPYQTLHTAYHSTSSVQYITPYTRSTSNQLDYRAKTSSMSNKCRDTSVDSEDELEFDQSADIASASSKPELYPESLLTSHSSSSLPNGSRSAGSMVRVSCFQLLHNANIYLEFIIHKLDILEQSIQLFGLNIDAMTDLAVTTPSGTMVDTEFCICHKKFSTDTIRHGIWRYFCDSDKCNYCMEVFDKLASRPARSYQLSVLDLNLELITSGALVVTGQSQQTLTVIIEAQSSIWSNCDEDCLLDLSNFLEYVMSSTREGKVTVLVDARQTSEHILQLIMDSLLSTQRISKGGIQQVTYITDKAAQTSRKITKTVIDSITLEIEFTTQAEYSSGVELDKIPTPLGGTFQFDPDCWIRAQAGLEKHLQHQQRVLDGLLQSTHLMSLLPRTIRHACKVIPDHEKCVRHLEKSTKQIHIDYGSNGSSSREDNSLDTVDISQLLDDLITYLRGTPALRQIMDGLQSLIQIIRQIKRLRALIDQRYTQLRTCQKLWNCIEQITKTLTLLRKAQDLIKRQRTLSNNLKSAQLQHSNFIKIKPSVLRLIKQGDDLIKDTLSLQSEMDTRISWLDELSTKLYGELEQLKTQLDKTELMISDTYFCYSTLDQAYDWAVESMRFISGMNMDDCRTEAGIETLYSKFTKFIKQHSIIEPSTFDQVLVKAKDLGNRKLMDQCKVAKARCEETKQVIKVREATIFRAKEEIEAQKAKRITLEELAANTNISPFKPSGSEGTNSKRSSESNNNVWITQQSSAASKDISSADSASDIASAESCDTLTNSQERLLTDSDSDSTLRQRPSPLVRVTPASNQSEETLSKRKSFAGFDSKITSTTATKLAQSPERACDPSCSRQSTSEGDTLEVLEDSATLTRYTSRTSVLEQLENINKPEAVDIDCNSDSGLATSVSVASSTERQSTDDLNISSSSATKPDETWSPLPANSHLYLSSNRLLAAQQWQSMSDLRLTEAELRSRRTLAHIMDELLLTERDYVMSLRLVVEKYIPEMNREDVPQPLRGNRGVIFGNVEKIYEFHSQVFLEHLKECENQPFKISKCFLEHEKQFMMYAMYNKNKPKSDGLMTDHGTEFFSELQAKLNDKMNLASYLLKPVQRMGKYSLILKQIIKECPESAAEYQELLAAQDMIKFCLQHGNDLLAVDSLKECDVNLQEQGMLLLQGEFSVQKGRGKAVQRHLFLFENLLVFAKTKKIIAGRDEYIYKLSLKTEDLGLTENVGTSGLKFEVWFRKRSRETWIVQAPSVQVKNNWVRQLEKILWHQALKNRESRLTELSSMGIGHKPSLDLKQSSDNITERQIDTSNRVIKKKYMPESGGCDNSKPLSSSANSSSASLVSSASKSELSIAGKSSNIQVQPISKLDLTSVGEPLSFEIKRIDTSDTSSNNEDTYTLRLREKSVDK